MTKCIEVYTDGGCRCHVEKGGTIKPTDKSAYAFLLRYGDYEKIYGEAFYGRTNNDMELTAVLEALKRIKHKHTPIRIYSDSKYVVDGINKQWYVKWRMNGWTKKGGLANANLWKSLIELYETFDDIEIHHVKGHNGHVDNESVDLHLNRLMDELD